MERERALLTEISLLENILNDFPTIEELKKYIDFLRERLEEKSQASFQDLDIPKKSKNILNDGTYGAESYFLFDELQILRYCNSIDNPVEANGYLRKVIGIAQRVYEYIKYLQNKEIKIVFIYEVRPPIDCKIVALLEEYRENLVLIEKVINISDLRVMASKKELTISEDKILKGLGYSRKQYGICKIRNQILEEMFFKKVVKTKEILERELAHRVEIIEDISNNDLSRENIDKIDLRKFRRGELKRELLPFIEEFGLTVGETVASEKSQLIARRLRKMGWDSKETSVAETLRRMGFVEGKRK